MIIAFYKGKCKRKNDYASITIQSVSGERLQHFLDSFAAYAAALEAFLKCLASK